MRDDPGHRRDGAYTGDGGYDLRRRLLPLAGPVLIHRVVPPPPDGRQQRSSAWSPWPGPAEKTQKLLQIWPFSGLAVCSRKAPQGPHLRVGGSGQRAQRGSQEFAIAR